MNKENYSSQSSDNTKPDKQRALVLQGGGAPGAYEVGVLKTLYKKLTQEDKKMDKKIGCYLILLQAHL